MRKLFIALSAALTFPTAGLSDVIYNNAVANGLSGAGLATGPRPGGGFYSEVQLGNTFAGFTANTVNFRVGDDFTVGALGAKLDRGTFFVYQTSATTPTISGATIRIRAGGPVGGVITTGTFASASFTDIYRIFNATPNDLRRVQEVQVNFPDVSLPPGNYFVEMEFTGVAGSGQFVPPLTQVGVLSLPGANGRQQDIATGVWSPAVDGTNIQEFPFILEGTICIGKLFAYSSSREFVEVNPATAVATPLHTLPVGTPTIGSFAYDPAQQRMFASSTSTHELYRFNEETGALTLVGPYGLAPNPFVHGIEWDSQVNRLFGSASSSGGDQFLGISTSTGAAIQIGPLGFGTNGFNNFGFNSNSNVWYCTNSGTDSLYTVNRATGATALVGPLGGPTSPNGLAFAEDLNVMFLIENNGNLWRVNMATGASTLVGDIAATGNWLGLVYVNEERLAPSLFGVGGGTLFGGNLASLSQSDDDKVFILCDENDPNGTLVWQADHCVGRSSRLHVRIESQSSRNDLTEFAELFNVNTLLFQSIGSRTTTLVDTIVNYHVNTNANNFMPANGHVVGRFRYIPQADLEAADGWLISIDQIRSTNAP